jgi:hypothetical protein
MQCNEIDALITGGETSIANCFAVAGCVYCYIPESNAFIWVSERDESKHSSMLSRLAQLGQSFNDRSELQQALQRHPSLSHHVERILSFL